MSPRSLLWLSLSLRPWDSRPLSFDSESRTDLSLLTLSLLLSLPSPVLDLCRFSFLSLISPSSTPSLSLSFSFLFSLVGLSAAAGSSFFPFTAWKSPSLIILDLRDTS